MSLPTPDRITWELHEVREKLDAIEEGYANLYDAAYRPRSGSSLGKLAAAGQRSDSTGDAATNGNQAMQRGKARRMAGKVRGIRRLATDALDAHDDAWQELPGGTREAEREKRQGRKREWMERWADLTCGCSQHELGQWIVSRECSEHMELIPLEQRIPFSQIRLHGAKFGPFQPVERGQVRSWPKGARRERPTARDVAT